jgi:predicted XRE-type DNA-binding protein
MSDKAFNSVWDAIEDSPAMAENMKLRSSLMMAIAERIKANGLSQTEAAALFAVTQPRISDLIRGKINLFSIDTLVAMLGAAGIGIDMKLKVSPVLGSKRSKNSASPRPKRQVVHAGAKAARRRAVA